MYPVPFHKEERTSVRGERERPLSGARTRRDVLFVTNGKEHRSAGLLRAAALARMFGGELSVACAAPPLRHNMLFPHRNAAQVSDAASEHVGQRARLRAFCDAVLTEALPADRLFVREGGVAQVAVDVADEIGAALIVLGTAGDGRTATEVAGASRLPVLVARRPRRGSIVAATDLSDPRFPVLRHAGELADRMEERATIVHNVPPLMDFGLPGPGLHGWVGAVPQEEIVAEYGKRLRGLTRSLGIAAEPVVLSRPNAVEAIREIAREGDADLLIVGTHPRSWFGRLLSSSVAETLVDETDRSVLVLPLTGDEADGELAIETAWAA